MPKIEKALYYLNQLERESEEPNFLATLDARSKLIVTIVFLVMMLSLPLTRITTLILFFLYPIIASSLSGIRFNSIARHSLVVLPFVFFVGIFNPILDREIAFYVGTVGVSYGWVSFLSILIRGLLAVQAVLILIHSSGFYNLCRSLHQMGVPSLFTTQILFVYRYLFVLLQETLSMQRARDARSFGRTSYPLRQWGVFVGQLLLRTVERSERIHRAMVSRGFNGKMESRYHAHLSFRDFIYIAVCCLAFVFLRYYPVDTFFSVLPNAI